MTEARQKKVTGRTMAIRYAHSAFILSTSVALGLATGGRAMATPPWTIVAGPPLLVSQSLTGPVYVPDSGPQTFPSAVAKWERSVRRVVASMEAKGLLASPAQPGMRGKPSSPGPYYLFVQQPGSTFLEEVRNTMEYELLKRGLVVVRSPVGATVINLDIDVIHWSSMSSHSELVWRAAVFGNGSVLMKSTDLLEISQADIALYQGPTTLGPLASPGVATLGTALPLHYAR